MIKTRNILLLLLALVVGYITFGYAWHFGTVAYYEYKCKTYGGDFVHKTVDNVAGVYQIRLRDPRFLFDRLNKRDIPEDPYGHTDWESQNPQTLFVDPAGGKFHFLETTKAPDFARPESITQVPKNTTPTGERYWRYSVPNNPESELLKVEQVSFIKSKYGFTWREVRTFWDHIFGLWGGELIVRDLETDEVLGVRKGFFYLDRVNAKLGYCPKKTHTSAFDFVSNVLQPIKQTREE